jgi:methylglutaconyl-CoA hydratase
VGSASFCQLAINATEWQTASWAREKGLYAEVFADIAGLDQAVYTLAKRLAASNPEAMMLLKKAAWTGTDHWDTLLIERAEMSGKLVLSDFTVNAINQFKSK